MTSSYRLKGKWFLQHVQWTDLDRSHRQESHTEHSSLMLVYFTVAQWIVSNSIFAQETDFFILAMLSVVRGRFQVDIRGYQSNYE